jgi:hypothetical protein
MRNEDYLFSSFDWNSVDRNQRIQMAKEIEAVNADQLLNTSAGDLAIFFAKKFKIDIPILQIDDLVIDESEKQIDVSKDPNRLIRDRTQPLYLTGTEIKVEIPFTGETDAFKIQPNPHTYNPPRAFIHGSFVEFSITGTNLNADSVRQTIDGTVNSIQSCLATLRINVAGLNDQLFEEAKSAIENRRTKILASRSMVAALGYKVKEREGTTKTYVAPEVRRKITAVMPAASFAPYKPEPALSSEDYEHILEVMQNMTQVMELSPSAFHDVNEEALRSHFLVQLNGHYQGQATGETFNYEGKTDILIRSDGRNIFIAECKFWAGPKMLSDTIDQLLSYSSWRDTKTAIVIFNRNRDFSKVLAAIPDRVRAHPHYKRDLAGSKESCFRYLFSNRDDANRELSLTVLAFDVPTPRAA